MLPERPSHIFIQQYRMDLLHHLTELSGNLTPRVSDRQSTILNIQQTGLEFVVRTGRLWSGLCSISRANFSKSVRDTFRQLEVQVGLNGLY